MVVRSAAAARLVVSRRQLRNVIRNINRRHVRIFSDSLRRLRHSQKEGNQDKRKHAGMHADRRELCPAEILILRPYLLHLHRSHFKRKRSLLRWEEKVFHAVAKSAKVRVPATRQLPSPRSLRHRLRAEEFAQVIPEASAKPRRHQRRTVIAANLHRLFKKELF